MADFKKLANVETIEEVTEEDTVLVVHGGEVKQAPKELVGGAVKPDIVLHADTEMNITAETEIENVFEFLGTCAENGVIPNVIVHMTGEMDGVKMYGVTRPCMIMSNPDGGIILGTLEFAILCASDNTFTIAG